MCYCLRKRQFRGKREEGRGKREEGRGKREERREKREEGEGRREEGRGKREERREKREEGRGKRDEGIVLGSLQVFGLNFLLICKILKNPPVTDCFAISPFSLAFTRQLPHHSWGSICLTTLFKKEGLFERCEQRRGETREVYTFVIKSIAYGP
jgi:hypothetical protein